MGLKHENDSGPATPFPANPDVHRATRLLFVVRETLPENARMPQGRSQWPEAVHTEKLG